MTYVPIVLGYIASALWLAALFMRAPIRLRQLAIVSSAAFVVYGVLAQQWPIVVLFAILLPLNVWRLRELNVLTKKVQSALTGDLSMEWLRPFMQPRKFAAGEYV